ncbi:hypothetical protein RRG08_046903 [Elysia crispata]|uniref:Superoxide dismutase [Cu-Zn] n=1 Tax=Elysia crispata TaxID=231223 RepID=A0AAE1DHM8_9GAST|nr:hypothetical protein RRG08_046903 [Elysia crispata]
MKAVSPRAAVCYVQPDPSSSQQVEGWVAFFQSMIFIVQGDPNGNTDIHVSLSGFSPLAPDGRNRKHGFHIHEYGDLSGGCASTGGHFNPTGDKHGGPNDALRHFGDLGNTNQGDDGNVFEIFSDRVVTLYGQYSVIGRSVVIHEQADDLGVVGDEGSLTTGNAGARIACCVIGNGT